MIETGKQALPSRNMRGCLFDACQDSMETLALYRPGATDNNSGIKSSMCAKLPAGLLDKHAVDFAADDLIFPNNPL
jgi:hypothetical protein